MEDKPARGGLLKESVSCEVAVAQLGVGPISHVIRCALGSSFYTSDYQQDK